TLGECGCNSTPESRSRHAAQHVAMRAETTNWFDETLEFAPPTVVRIGRARGQLEKIGPEPAPSTRVMSCLVQLGGDRRAGQIQVDHDCRGHRSKQRPPVDRNSRPARRTRPTPESKDLQAARLWANARFVRRRR